MALRRGFKADAKRLAGEVRDLELGCGLWVPFDPWRLAELYGISVQGITEVGASAPTVEYLTITSPRLFSGALLPIGTGRAIVENDGHDRPRRRSTVCHEMCHVLLEHRFTTVLVREGDNCRNSDRNQELEAAELAGELLVPAAAARTMGHSGLSDEEVARKYEVSLEMARWRMQVSGARKIAKNIAARRP